MIHKGMKLVLTQNVRKQADYVNGMECIVEDFQANGSGGSLRVRTRTGQRLAITMWTDKHKQYAKYFPIRWATPARCIRCKMESSST